MMLKGFGSAAALKRIGAAVVFSALVGLPEDTSAQQSVGRSPSSARAPRNPTSRIAQACRSPLTTDNGQRTTDCSIGFEESGTQAVPLLGTWRPLRIAKWTLLAAGTASAGYGFSTNRDADERYVEIEQICQTTPARCAGGATGRYADPALEAMYQDVRSLDNRSRLALIAGQVSLISSVVLFILDLRTDSSPPNVPYDPDRLRIDYGIGTIGVHIRIR
jgi:hypothetical protein